MEWEKGWDRNQICHTRNHSPHPMTHNLWEILLKFSSANTLSEIVVVWQAPLATDRTFLWLLLYCDLLGGLTDWTELPASLTLGSIRSANQKAVPQNLAGVPSPHFKANVFWRGITYGPPYPLLPVLNKIQLECNSRKVCELEHREWDFTTERIHLALGG